MQKFKNLGPIGGVDAIVELSGPSKERVCGKALVEAVDACSGRLPPGLIASINGDTVCGALRLMRAGA